MRNRESAKAILKAAAGEPIAKRRAMYESLRASGMIGPEDTDLAPMPPASVEPTAGVTPLRLTPADVEVDRMRAESAAHSREAADVAMGRAGLPVPGQGDGAGDVSKGAPMSLDAMHQVRGEAAANRYGGEVLRKANGAMGDDMGEADGAAEAEIQWRSAARGRQWLRALGVDAGELADDELKLVALSPNPTLETFAARVERALADKESAPSVARLIPDMAARGAVGSEAFLAAASSAAELAARQGQYTLAKGLLWSPGIAVDASVLDDETIANLANLVSPIPFADRVKTAVEVALNALSKGGMRGTAIGNPTTGAATRDAAMRELAAQDAQRYRAVFGYSPHWQSHSVAA